MYRLEKGGVEVGSLSEAMVLNIDFAPTILEMAGGDPTRGFFDGIFFKPVLDGETDQARDTFFFELGYARAVTKDGFKYYAVRYPEYAETLDRAGRAAVLEKYNAGRRMRKMPMVNQDPDAPYSHFSLVPGGEQAEHESYGKRPGFFDLDQLYDLENDPGETNNLAANPEYASRLASLKSELKAYIDDLPGDFSL